MTRLLVSVRSLAEAQTAFEAGVDLIDLKEPTHGALGAVDRATVDEVVEFVAGRVPLSMALGELIDLPDDVAEPWGVSRGLTYVKAGLARCAARTDWPRRLAALSQSLPSTTSPVAVVYADAAQVGAPGVDEILDAATSANCRAVLVDTALKKGRSLIDHWSPTVVRRFIADVRSRGLISVVGGSLTIETIPTVAVCGPDYVAVRGAACDGGRGGTISAARIRELLAVLA